MQVEMTHPSGTGQKASLAVSLLQKSQTGCCKRPPVLSDVVTDEWELLRGNIVGKVYSVKIVSIVKRNGIYSVIRGM